MRFPRMTIRRWMVAVAIVAVLLCVGAPICNRLLWLYRSPFSVKEISGEIHPKTMVNSARVGRSTTIDCSYDVATFRTIPPGLIYRVNVHLKLVDRSGAVVAAHRKTRYLVSGGAWGRSRGDFEQPLTASQAGRYQIRYEVEVTDLFGRTNTPALATSSFLAE